MAGGNFKQHFDMISLHEPVQRKAKFWTSYVRALKGTEDMRANEDTKRRVGRPLSEIPDLYPRFYDDLPTAYSEDPSNRIKAPGYRYVPVSRETYGMSPRPIEPSLYSRTSRPATRR